jgi:PII-like signaling protein
MSFQSMCALRVYLRRGDNSKEKGFWRRLMRRPLADQLLQLALSAGVTHASVSLGHMGFARGARGVSIDISEIPPTTLPVCLELVAPKPLLEQFVRDHAKQLAAATLVMLEGVHVSPSIVEGDIGQAPHHVEYVHAGNITVPVDHVDLEGGGQQPPKSASA